MDLPRGMALTELLEECGCCEGLEASTPVEVYNRPGLSAIAYRIGTHARFKRSMLARLSSAHLPALRDLNTRDDDDFAVALLDGWATVADVLTFYSERIANESYLRTATERVSLLHLARLIGYELGSGVAASTYLAFELEDAPTAPRVVSLDKGTKVQSLPGQDELPQTFETVEKIEARPEWNELRPRQTEPRGPGYRHVYTYLTGVATNLGPGDPILIVGKNREEHADSEQWEIRRVAEVRPDAEADRTYVRWNEPLGHVFPRVETPEEGAKVYALRTRAALFGHNAPEWKSLPVTLRVGEKNPKDDAFIKGAYASRKNSWADAKLKANETEINLDAVYSRVVANGWIVLASPDYAELYRVRSTSEETKADFNMTAKTTRVEISGENTEKFSPRNTTVYAQSEPLEVAAYPLVEPVEGDEISLDQPSPDFGAGRTIIVSGKRTRVVVTDKAGKLSLESEDGSREVALQPGDLLQAVGARQEASESSSSSAPRFVKWHLMDKEGFVGFVTAEEDEIVPKPATEDDETVSEVAHAEEVKSSDPDHTTIVLAAPLRNSYDRASAVIYANVAHATHGETRQEVLGSGDASAAFQRFTLHESPLTHTSAPTPGGTESSLEVRVGDIRWHEVPDLYGRGPDERVFVTRTDDESKTTVQFGDGHTGVRLPTGQENVRATYRKGLGTDGLVRAEQLSLLMTPVLGVRGVKNPLAASGADDPESRDEARRNAPLTVLTLDRVVSLRDYEDFARAYAGIAKALATWIWTGETREVFVTVAGPGGRRVEDDLRENLVKAMRAAGDRHLPLRVERYEPASFGMAAKIETDPDHIPERVKTAVEAALRAQFGFEARSFGQGVALSEVIAVIQSVSGVVMADVDELYRIPKSATEKQPQPFLEARAPQPGEENGNVLAAELLTLDPQKLSLEMIV